MVKGDRKIETKDCHGYLIKADKEQGILTHYVSVTGIVDRDKPPDLIELGAFAKTLQESGPAGTNKIRVLWQHQWGEVIGHPLEMAVHPRAMLPPGLLSLYPSATGGLYVVTKLNLDVQRGREAFALYRDGDMDEWSIGFDAVRHSKDHDILKDQGVFVRRIQEARLWEYSTVTWGANQATITVAAKGRSATDEKKVGGAMDLPLASRDREWDASAADQRVRGLAGGPDKEAIDWLVYGKAFFWHDPENKENFDGYKLGFADAIDNELQAVPRGIFAVAGGRGVEQADIPESDKAAIRGRVNKYYAKMREEFGDETLESPFERIEATLEQTLTSGRYIIVIKDAPQEQLASIATQFDTWWSDPTKTFFPINYNIQLVPVLPDVPKAVNLSELVQDVQDAFSAQYNTPGNYRYWVMKVYDEYVIVNYSDESGSNYYQVAYTRTGAGDYQFAPRAEWIEGKFEFVPLETGSPQGDLTSAEPPAEQALTPAERLARRLKISELDLQLIKRQ